MTRRTQIADAAIATLAHEGMRGLTHRAVDRAAGLAEGSSSYYYRTRLALLRAAAERLGERDATEFPRLPLDDLDAFARATAKLLHQWLTVDRDRQVARYELALEAARRPELSRVLMRAGNPVRVLVADVLSAHGVRDADRTAHTVVAMIDGLIFNHLLGAEGHKLTQASLRTAITGLLAGFARPA